MGLPEATSKHQRRQTPENKNHRNQYGDHERTAK